MGTKQYDSATDLLTFSRASSATFLGSNGLLQTAANNIPRIEYDTTGAVKGLLIEEARTNLVTSSGDLSGTDWAGGLAMGPLTVGSPFGTYQTISPPSDGGNLAAAQGFQIGIQITVGATYVGWALVKYSAGSGWFDINMYDTGKGSAQAYFDVQNGVVGAKNAAIIGHGMVDYGDGWWLCWASANAVATSGGLSVEVPNGNGVQTCTATDVILIAGTQFELGSFLTSYIPTTGAAATRARDLAEIPTSAFGYNNDAGTVVCEFDSATISGSTIFTLDLDGAGFSNGITAIIYPAGRISYQAVTVGATQVNLNFDAYATASQVSKVATVYAKDDFAAVLNGGAVATDTAASLPTVGLLRLGVYLGGASFPMSGHIKSIQYYPRRLTNTQLQELTT